MTRFLIFNCTPLLIGAALTVAYLQAVRWRTRQLHARRAKVTELLSDAPEMLPCPECQSTCELCGGSGERRCEMTRCGGQGYLALAAVECSGDGCRVETGKTRRDCAICEGSGVEVTQRAECPSCHGNKVVKCVACHGTGRASTGREGGAYQAHGGQKEPPMCSRCNGLARVPQMSTHEAISA